MNKENFKIQREDSFENIEKTILLIRPNKEEFKNITIENGNENDELVSFDVNDMPLNLNLEYKDGRLITFQIDWVEDENNNNYLCVPFMSSLELFHSQPMTKEEFLYNYDKILKEFSQLKLEKMIEKEVVKNSLTKEKEEEFRNKIENYLIEENLFEPDLKRLGDYEKFTNLFNIEDVNEEENPKNKLDKLYFEFQNVKINKLITTTTNEDLKPISQICLNKILQIILLSDNLKNKKYIQESLSILKRDNSKK